MLAVFIGILKPRDYLVCPVFYENVTFCLPDNKVLPNKTRSSWLQERIMKCVAIYILFHLKYKCATTFQSFTVGPGLSPCKQNLGRGLDSCNSASFL